MPSSQVTPPLVGLIMAAGRSRRFGERDKRLAQLPNGASLLESVLVLAQRHYASVRVVVRTDDDLAALGLRDDTPVVISAHADRGLGASLAAAFEALQRDPTLADSQAAAVMLADMPFLQGTTLQELNGAASASRIVRPVRAGRAGHPVLFGRDLWPSLSLLKDGRGGRSVIQANQARLIEIEVDDPAIHQDIDVPADLPTGNDPSQAAH